MRRVERERGGKTGTPEKSIAREAANGITIRASNNGHHAHAGPVCPPSVVDIVPIHGWDASEITIATVAVDLDSNPPLGALFTLVLFPSQVQLEARSTSLVETFSSRAERRGLSRFPPSSCRARARISTYVTQHAILSVIGREPDLRPSCSHVCNFNGTRQSIALVGSARRRARARACHWRFSAPSPREISRIITRAHMRSTRQPRRRRRSRRIRNQDRDHNGHDQLSVLSLRNTFPKLTARARSQVRSRRGTVTDAAAAAQHTAVAVVIGGRTAARWRARCGSGE